MVSVLLSRFVVLTFGTVYPAYRSYKAVRTKDVREYVKWMMYWIVWACFCFIETFLDVFLAFWFPFYYEAKILFVIYLLSPWTKGASILYRKWIHPTLQRHERDIDLLLDQAKVEGYSAVLRLGSKGIVAARDFIAVAALKGHEQLTTQLHRSYSASDVNEDGGDDFGDGKGVAPPVMGARGTHRRALAGAPTRRRAVTNPGRIEERHDEEAAGDTAHHGTERNRDSEGADDPAVEVQEMEEEEQEEEREMVWEGSYDDGGELVSEVQLVRRSTRHQGRSRQKYASGGHK